jgi:tetratricopeptide (TPR) repeat protein
MPEPRIIVLLMVKNEFRIIVRSIMSTLKIADAICVSDTGSTDDTLKVLDAYFPTLSVPAKYYQHSWTNFGVNRSQSFHDAVDFCKALGWDLANTYALAVDADMVLQMDPTFKKSDLNKKGYSLIQKAGTLHYANCRLMRLDQAWRCVGATHEYWDGPNEGTFDSSKLWIDDKNDGGCKADKFVRDERLLLAELAEQPTNVRTHFYLAQTYKCLGNTEKAIEFYKKRIALGGWWEELWYSHYMIAKMHLEAKRPEKAELWVLKAQKLSNYRAEALYLLVRHFRIEGQQWKAMHYLKEAKKVPKPAVALFLESEIYDHLLDYENTILQYYTNSNKKEGLMASIRYAMHPQSGGYLDNVFSNLQFYTTPLLPSIADTTLKSIPLSVPSISLEVFKPSSTSLAYHKGNWVANVRYVNYETSRQGAYRSRDTDGIVRTINGYVPSFDALEGYADVSPLFVDSPSAPLVGLPSHPTNVMGLEDVRLFSHRGTLYYTAASKVHNAENKVRMVMGRYDPTSTPSLTENRCLLPPTPTDCEKNWLTIGDYPASHDPLFIYKWHPFQFGTIDASTNTLQIRSTISTPPYFQKVRGSANPVLMPGGKEYLAVVHTVKYETPRKYYHHLVALDVATLAPIRISAPFYFETHGIEYCIGFAIDTSSAASAPTLLFVYSTFDAEPKLVRLPLSAFDFVSI